MKLKEEYDVVIIGSGMGGLACASILSKEGYSVCVLEKNNQYGGNLQTFVRERTIFDTGIHYIGGLGQGQNLHKFFTYLGLMDELKLQELDHDGYDVISFDGDDNEYRYANGFDAFIDSLSAQFPEERASIEAYCNRLKEVCGNFPLYNLKMGGVYDEDLISIKARDCINAMTDNKKLQAVLAGTNFLYAGDGDKTPMYVHALASTPYIQSAWRCVNGGSQISKILIRQIRAYNNDTFRRKEVVRFGFEDDKLVSAITKDGLEVRGKLFISNIDPKQTIRMLGENRIKKTYAKRIMRIESIVASFCVHIVFKPNTFPYLNHNYYHFKDYTRVWDAIDYTPETWPEGYMLSMGYKQGMGEWAENMTAMTYMKFEEVEQWADSFNTVVEKGERGQTYEEFKAEKAEVFLNEIEKKFPNIRACIQSVYTSSPLSFRDYIGADRGTMYGPVKNADEPIKCFLSPRTKIKNLYFTGQGINLHGVLGVTVSAVLTCSLLLGRKYLLEKILAANGETLENVAGDIVE